MSTEHEASPTPLNEPAPVDGASTAAPLHGPTPSDPASLLPAAPSDPAPQPLTADATAADAPHADAPRADLSLAQCTALLAERFPALFGADGPPKPIKLRIQVDIQQRAPGVFTRKALSIFLHRHTTSTAYLRALTASPHRFDLDGLPAGEIADEHRQAAQQEWERRRALVAARRAAERGVGRPPSSRSDAAPAGGAEGSPTAEREERIRLPRRPPRRPPSVHLGGPIDAPNPAVEGVVVQPADSVTPPRGPAPGDPSSKAARDARERRHDRERSQAREPQQSPRRPPPPHRAGPTARASVSMAPIAHDRPSAVPPTGSLAESGPGEETNHVFDPARRERAQMLRTWEASSLSKANFCVLKRLSEPDFDALIEQARRERGSAAPRHRV